MSNFKPVDGSKEDFRKYLERKGVMDSITKVLIKCNADRPENAIEYLLENLGETQQKDTIERLENDLSEARNEIEALKLEIKSLRVNSVKSNSNSSDDSLQEPQDDSGVSADQNNANNGSAEGKEALAGPEKSETVANESNAKDAATQ
ncbi:c-Myc-binding protein [Sabethes cyaneus]|uniref:c-Myc-binding protein n=1 Tax=Sabethes cyaneus TaxID=53552 RepID=UPI00221E2EBB|nr:c-Myc-binding protein [Sabethes cyaneus]